MAFLALAGATDAQAQIAGTKHDLTTAPGPNVTGSSQLCVYCHTPHGGDISVSGAPLWNKVVPADTFTLYTAPTQTQEASMKAVSLVCMSCHDGVGIIDAMLNPPNGETLGTFNDPDGILDPDGSFALGADANIGATLADDHPISMEYPTVFPATGFNDIVASNLKLIGGGGTLTTNPTVECATCHDPHGTTNPIFLREPAAGSAICTTCHIK